MTLKRPTREEIDAAYGQRVPDIIATGLRVLFCGINPSLYSAAVGHHFARPGNRFWPALHAGGITPHRFSPAEDRSLLDLGYGLTNVVSRATAGAAELDDEELRAGGQTLLRKLRRHRPHTLAILGVGAYRTAFDAPRAALGPQPERLEGVLVWVLPNPSGLNAHYRLDELAARFAELRRAVSG